jgi:nicotinamidase-related amidase
METSRRRRSSAAVLVIDVLSDFAFDGGDSLLRQFRRCVSPITQLLLRARDSRVPVIYVNDNFRHWRANADELVARGMRPGARGADVVTALAPDRRDYFVLKPRNSGFYLTPLHLMLTQLRVRRLVLLGVATDNCVLLTACDAHTRGYRVQVPADGVAALTPARHRNALQLIRTSLEAATPIASRLRF